MHGDLSETALLVLAIEKSLLIAGRCYPTHPITIGPFCLRGHPKRARNRPTGRYARRPLLATAGSCPVPLRLSALQPFDTLLSQNDT